MVMFVLTLGSRGGGRILPGTVTDVGSGAASRLTQRGAAWGRGTRSQLRVLPGPILTSFFCLLYCPVPGTGRGAWLRGRAPWPGLLSGDAPRFLLSCFAPQYDYSFRTEQSAAARLPPSPTRCPPVPQS